MPFGSGLSAPLAGCRSRTLTTGVHLRSAIHPLLGRLRIGAPRLWPLFPKLHTSDCSFACPGSSTWVDKVPSRDTPSLNLADRRGGVDPGNPQVARTPSRTSGNSCARTGSPTGSSPPTATSSITAARRGTSSRISLGSSCPSDCETGLTGSDQRDLVLRDETKDQRRHPLRSGPRRPGRVLGPDENLPETRG